MELLDAIGHLTKMLNDPNHNWGCEECKKEHEQLLRWLGELYELRKRTSVWEARLRNTLSEMGSFVH